MESYENVEKIKGSSKRAGKFKDKKKSLFKDKLKVKKCRKEDKSPIRDYDDEYDEQR